MPRRAHGAVHEAILFLVPEDGTRLRIERTHVGKYLDDYVGFEVLIRGPIVLGEDHALVVRPMAFQEVVAPESAEPGRTVN